MLALMVRTSVLSSASVHAGALARRPAKGAACFQVLPWARFFCPACSQRAVGQAVHKHPPCLLWYVCWELLFYAVDTIFHSCAMHQALTGVVQH